MKTADPKTACPSNPNPARQCPRFDQCSVNNCPLTVGYPGHFTHPTDKERRCPVAKSIRQRIAATATGLLPMSGLTVAESAAKRLFESKPVADKIKFARQGKDALNTLRA